MNPKVIVFLGGSNNVGDRPGDDLQAAAIAPDIKAVPGPLQQKTPEATVLLTGILPGGTDPQLHGFIQELSANVASNADGKKCVISIPFHSSRMPTGAAPPELSLPITSTSR